MSEIKVFLTKVVDLIGKLPIYDEVLEWGDEGPVIAMHIPNAFSFYQVDLRIVESDLEVSFTKYDHYDCGWKEEAYDNTWEVALFPMADPELFEKVIQKIKDEFLPIVEEYALDFEDKLEECKIIVSEIGDPDDY